MKIFLVGYMGCGKSTVGKKLATRLEVPFVDLDWEIERLENQRVREIFQQGGEAGFRGIESKVLEKVIASRSDFVMATGGGTPCFYNNMQQMNEAGITVYLQMDVKSLAYRLENASEDRPLITDLSGDDLLQFVQQHLNERSNYYDQSKIIINALGMNAVKFEMLVQKIASIPKD